MKRYLFIILACACLSAPAFSHSGGTDEFGCHTNKKTGVYHCH